MIGYRPDTEVGVRASRRMAVAGLPAMLAAGCLCQTTLPDDRELVVGAVRQRAVADATLVVPESVNLADGLSETEAVQLALRNNAAFHELLVDLGLAHADLVQAGQLTNPDFQYIFGTAAKPFSYVIDLTVDTIEIGRAHV